MNRAVTLKIQGELGRGNKIKFEVLRILFIYKSCLTADGLTI